MKKLSDISFYTKPVKYVDGTIDVSGIETAIQIAKMTGLSYDELFLMGDTEDEDFSDEMESLEDFFYGDNMKKLGYDELVFDTGNVELTMKRVAGYPDSGKIIKVSNMNPCGEIALYFGDKQAVSDFEEILEEDKEKIEDLEIMKDLLLAVAEGKTHCDIVSPDFRPIPAKIIGLKLDNSFRNIHVRIIENGLKQEVDSCKDHPFIEDQKIFFKKNEPYTQDWLPLEYIKNLR